MAYFKVQGSQASLHPFRRPWLRTPILALAHSAAEYCAPAWRCSAHTPHHWSCHERRLANCDWMPASIHQRTIFLSSQASNLLSFVAMEPHSL